MNELVENIASSGELAQCSPDMKVLLYIFVFTIILTLILSLIDGLKGIGK